jgi:ADP-ribose pyrophosphatase YjhB (NUDIX family)
MKYCPECGTKLQMRWVSTESRERLTCVVCNAIRYENPKILVALMVTYGDCLLMCRRGHAPAEGLWTPPAGFMEQGETLEEAAARETLEEAGVRLASQDLVLYAVTNLPRISEVYVCFRATAASAACSPGSESLEVGYFTESDIPWDRLAFPEMASFLRLFFREHSARDFGIHLSRVDEHGRFRRGYRLVPSET